MSLPVLPWFNFDKKVGYEKWHRCTKFDFLNGEIRYLIQQRQPQALAGKPFPWDPAPDGIPPLYPAKPHAEFPSWLIYDKHVLCFEAYFHETLIERNMEMIIRKVKIVYFLEDGTVQVNEGKIENSGLSQGTLINRQRIPFPRPNNKAFYEVIDFNIGKKVELFGREFNIYNCDKFTRQWLNKSGIAVPDPITPPHDQFNEELRKRKEAMTGRRPHVQSPGNLRQFLDFDRHVLRFYGYWDDRATEGGQLHKVVLQYYLSDDTIEIREQGGHFNLVRGRLPKRPATLPGPGATEPITLLNVLDKRVTTDCLNIGANRIKYYEDCDLSIGTCLNVYGRAIVLTACDTFTKEYYRAKYGLDTFGEAIPLPIEDKQILERSRSLPPWNGFGSFDDSARNCIRIIPKRDDFYSVAKKLENSSNGLDSRVLRFFARQIPEDKDTMLKHYIVCFYLADDTLSIFQEAERNSGYPSCFVFLRREAFKPINNIFVSKKPETYTKDDFWVGNTITVEGCTYHLIKADEYAMSYMEQNNQEFPKSNIDLILPKIREKLRPIYKNFVCKYFLPDGETTISQEQLWVALQELFNNDITIQEMLTVARRFAVKSPYHPYNKDDLKNICRNECRRLLFVGQERLTENLRYRDRLNTGFISKNEAYSICRGAHVPLEQEVLKYILNSHVLKNEVGDVNIDDLLSFFDPAGLPTSTCIPFSHQREFSEFTLLAKNQEYTRIDSMLLLEILALEEHLKKES